MEHKLGLRTTGVLTFLLIAFGLAWAAIFGAQALDLSLANPLVQLPGAFAPAIAALAVRRFVTREGFRDAGLAPRVKPARRYYLLAWIGPVLVFGATLGLAAALGLFRPDFSPLRTLAAVELPELALLLALPVLTAPIFWGEEFGWRSYLQQRLSRSPVAAAVITGVVWGIWHFPLAFTDYVDGNPLVGMMTWTLRSIPLAIILGWLFLRSGSVWVPCIAHAGNNLTIGSLSEVLLIEGAGLDDVTVELLALAPLAAIALWILLTGRLTNAKPPGSPDPATDAREKPHAA
jgi:membrane protease YdiL (CAAX protease family)